MRNVSVVNFDFIRNFYLFDLTIINNNNKQIHLNSFVKRAFYDYS